MAYLASQQKRHTNTTFDSPTLVTPALGTPASGVITSLTGTLSSPTFVTPALGTPASGVVTNLTGTLSNGLQDNITRLGTVTTGTFQGTINGSTTFSADADQTTCQQWCNWNHQSTVAIRDSFGVSSVTDNGTGDATINFSADNNNADYSITGILNYGAGTNSHMMVAGCRNADCDPVAGSVRINALFINGDTQNLQDCQHCFIHVFGD